MSRLQLDRVEEVRRAIKAQQKISIPESLAVLADGLANRETGFAARDRPSRLGGCSFIRVAGQAVDLDNGNRKEIRRILDNMSVGAAFVVLGHGAPFKCGAVSAKQAALKSPSGKLDSEPEIVNQLVSRVSEKVADCESPRAEMENSREQARRIMMDSEFAEIIVRKNITVVAAVCTEVLMLEALNKPENFNLYTYHPKLKELEAQLGKVVKRAIDENMPMNSHYAHAIFIYDPSQLREVLDPNHPKLELGGVSCVDARLAPLSPDGPRYMFRLFPNQGFNVTVHHEADGRVEISSDDGGSTVYALRHVGGVKETKHLVIVDTTLSLARARATREGLLKIREIAEATSSGETISLVGFDGEGLRLVNDAQGINADIEYDPKYRILGK